MTFPYLLHYHSATVHQKIYIQKEKTTLGVSADKDIYVTTLCTTPQESIYFIQSFSELFLVFEGTSECVFVNGVPCERKSLLPSDIITFSFLPEQHFMVERSDKEPAIVTDSHTASMALEEHLFELLSSQLKEQPPHAPPTNLALPYATEPNINISSAKPLPQGVPSIKPKLPSKSLFIAPSNGTSRPPKFAWGTLTILNGKNAHSFLYLTHKNHLLHIQKSIFVLYCHQNAHYLEHLFGEPIRTQMDVDRPVHYKIFDKQIFQIDGLSLQFSTLQQNPPAIS